jgi:adenosylcobyric acid synthase
MTSALAPCVMVQGTASGVGKSLLAAALCRIFHRAGYRVAPFKSQNMSLNAAVTSDGGEIGRAQAAQAEAAGVEATVHMNPILLKPEADDRSQVVVRGRAGASVRWAEYGRMAPELWPLVADSLARLRREHDLVVIEGAGSPAEINLSWDLANMRVAALAEAPVLLVGDIDRGGVFAALVGTLALLAPDDRARVAGLIVNRFRGDRAVLEPGLALLAERAGIPVLGVVPHLGDGLVPEEDSLGLETPPADVDDARVVVAVVRLPRLANFDDADPLAAEPGVAVRFVTRASEIDAADIVIVPGSKSTMADLAWLRARGLAPAIERAARDGRIVLGLCGGFQMLGEHLADPQGVETGGAAAGLGLLPVSTTFAAPKTTARVRARVLGHGPLAAAAGAEVRGYELHVGVTLTRGDDAALRLIERSGAPAHALDGAIAGTVIGTYVHGLLTCAPLRRALLVEAARRRGTGADPRWGVSDVVDRYERLADLVASALDLETLGRLARCPLSAVAPA